MKSTAALSPYFLEERAFMKKIKAKDKKAAIKIENTKPCLT